MIARIRSLNTLPMSEAKPLAIILAVALVVQVVYFVRIQTEYPSYGLTSEHYYSPPAINILHHGTFGFGEYPNIERTTKRPPLYSVALAGIYGLFGENEAHGLALNNVLLFSTIIVVYLIGRRFSAKIGLIAAVLFVLDPVGVINANKNVAAALYGFLFALFFLVTLRSFMPSVSVGRTALSSLLLGLATLTRAASLYLWVPLLISLIVTQRCMIGRVPLRRLALLALVLFGIQGAIIGGWMIRNNSVSGNPSFAGMTAIHLYNFYVPLVLGRAEGVPHEEMKARLQSELEADEEYLKLSSGGDKEQYQIRKSIDIILDHPVSAGIIVLQQVPVLFMDYPQNAASLFLSREKRDSINEYLHEYSRLKSSRIDVSGYLDVIRHYVDDGLILLLIHGIIFKLFLIIVMISGAVGMALLLYGREDRAVGILFVVVISYMVVVSSLWPTARLRMPILPVYAVVAAYGLSWSWNALRRRLGQSMVTRFPGGLKRRLVSLSP